MENYLKNAYIVTKAIGDAVNGKQNTVLDLQTAEDADCVVSFLKSHNLITLFDFLVDKDEFVRLKGEAQYKKVDDVVKQAVFRQLRYDAMTAKLSGLLSENNVRHIVLKGASLSKFYPENIVRTSSDIDIHIKKEDKNTADRILRDIGFTCCGTHDGHQFAYKMDTQYYVELHTNLEGYNKLQRKVLLSLASNAEKTAGMCCELTINDGYIYSLFHLYKHFVTSGVGVRMFLDLYLIRKNAVLDSDYIGSKLRELSIFEFETFVTQINRCMFEGESADEDMSEVIQFVFDSTAFGKTSSNYHLRKINKKLRYQNSFEKVKTDYCMSFEAMKTRYPVLERVPVLYPLTFIHRFFHGLIFNRDVLKKEKEREKSISQDRVEKYKRIFKTAKIIQEK